MRKLTFITASLLSVNLNAGIILSEFSPNPSGPDQSYQTIEIYGEANTGYGNLSLVAVEADTNGNIGSINSITSNISGIFNNNGLSLFDIPDLENPSFVLMLFQGLPLFNLDDDLDILDSGQFDETYWQDNVIDAVAVYDSNTDFQKSYSYASQVGGTSIVYSGDEPQLVFRDLSRYEWFAVNDPVGEYVYHQSGESYDFSRFAPSPDLSSFGAINPAVLHSVAEPTPIGLISFGALLALFRRKFW